MDDETFQHASLDELRADRSRGASELARRSLELLATFARECRAADSRQLAAKLDEFAAALAATRPSMAPLQTLTRRWRSELTSTRSRALADAREHAATRAQALVTRSVRAVEEAAVRASALVGEGDTLITHSLSSTVLALFRHLARRGIRVIVTESRPLREGTSLARRLSELGIRVDYITDAQVGAFIARANLAMVGADSVLGDGAVVNKAGTYLLALAAQDQGLPFYVCCESFKVTSSLATEITLEEKDPTELGAPQLPHVTVHNVYFDITPARLVRAWITEEGLTATPPRAA